MAVATSSIAATVSMSGGGNVVHVLVPTAEGGGDDCDHDGGHDGYTVPPVSNKGMVMARAMAKVVVMTYCLLVKIAVWDLAV